MKIDKYGGVHFTIVVTQESEEKIRERSLQKGISLTECIVDTALNIKLPDSSKLKAIRKPTKTISYKQQAKEYMDSLKNKEYGKDDVMNKENGASAKTKQFHLRVKPEVFEQIQKKAADMAMSVSDYVSFVTTRYDIEEVSMKLDKVAALLEKEKESKGEE